MIGSVTPNPGTSPNQVQSKDPTDALKLGYLAMMAWEKHKIAPRDFKSTEDYLSWLAQNINQHWEYRLRSQSSETVAQLENLGHTIYIVGIATPMHIFNEILLVSEN